MQRQHIMLRPGKQPFKEDGCMRLCMRLLQLASSKCHHTCQVPSGLLAAVLALKQPTHLAGTPMPHGCRHAGRQSWLGIYAHHHTDCSAERLNDYQPPSDPPRHTAPGPKAVTLTHQSDVLDTQIQQCKQDCDSFLLKPADVQRERQAVDICVEGFGELSSNYKS